MVATIGCSCSSTCKQTSARCAFRFHRRPNNAPSRTALSDVDGLLGGLDRLIAKKRDLKQAAMQQLLTGQTRLPGFHGEWEVKRLGELCSKSKAAANAHIVDRSL